MSVDLTHLAARSTRSRPGPNLGSKEAIGNSENSLSWTVEPVLEHLHSWIAPEDWRLASIVLGLAIAERLVVEWIVTFHQISHSRKVLDYVAWRQPHRPLPAEMASPDTREVPGIATARIRDYDETERLGVATGSDPARNPDAPLNSRPVPTTIVATKGRSPSVGPTGCRNVDGNSRHAFRMATAVAGTPCKDNIGVREAVAWAVDTRAEDPKSRRNTLSYMGLTRYARDLECRKWSLGTVQKGVGASTPCTGVPGQQLQSGTQVGPEPTADRENQAVSVSKIERLPGSLVSGVNAGDEFDGTLVRHFGRRSAVRLKGVSSSELHTAR